jgi:thiosulfate reductase cytochrome b subunit
MSRFPYITGIKQSIVNQIQNTSKIEAAGEKPFIQLTNFIGGTNTISYKSYLDYDLEKAVYGSNKTKQRFPPIITGCSVTAAGSLGSLRKARVTVKFASNADLLLHQHYFHVGNTQLVSWGWVYNKQKFSPTPQQTKKIAEDIVNNIDGYIKHTNEYNNNVDFLAGILTNFNMKVNEDASVEVEFEISSPSELVAYLEINKQGKTTSIEGKTEEKGMVQVFQALDLEGRLVESKDKEIRDYVINLKEDRLSTWTTFGETDDSYIQLGYALNQIINKARTSSKNALVNLDIEDSIANCNPNMISVTDNVIFPNKTTMGFKDSVEVEGGRVIEVDLSNTQPLGPFNFQRDNVGDIFPHDQSITIAKNFFQPFRAGYIKNIYIKTQFLIDIAKGVDTVHEYLEKVVSELNIAGAGLYELVIRESFKDKTGERIYSIVDLTLEPYSIPEIEIPKLELFTNTSRLVGLVANADLPKELATIMMMGGINADTSTISRNRNMAINMFNTRPDQILGKVTVTNNTETATLTTPTTTITTSTTTGTAGGTSQTTTDPKSTNPNFSPTWEAVKAVVGSGAIGITPTNTARMISAAQIYLKLPGANRVKLCASKKYGKQDQSFFAVFTDVSCVKTTYFGPDYKRKNALVPISVKLTILGLSGITIGQALTLDPTPVPWLSSDLGYWQVTNVEHDVDDSRWTTDVELKFRVK